MSDSDEASKQAVHSHHSVWMAHWMSTSFKSTNQGCRRLSICYESQEDNHGAKQHHLLSGPENVKCDSKNEKGLGEISGTKRVKILDDESSIAGSDRLRSERLNNQTFPMFNLQRKVENILARKNERPSSSLGEKLRSQTDDCSGYPLVSLRGAERKSPPMLPLVPDAESPSRENPLRPECTSEYPKRVMITENKSLAVTKPIQGDFMESTSKIIPYGFNFRKTPNPILESDERATNTVYHTNSVFLVNEKAINLFGRSRNLLRQNDTALLPHNPSTSRGQLPEFVTKQCHRMPDHTGIRSFPLENMPIELTKSKELYHGCFSLPSQPCSMRDKEATRTCTTVDSMEGSSRGRKKLSTTHQFLFTETTDFDLTKRGQFLKESMVPTKLIEKNSPELLCSYQDTGFPIKTGVKLQLLGSSTCCEGEKGSREFKTSLVNIRNESSAETNTMDLDTFRRNHVSGVVSSSSNKHFELEQQSPTSQAGSPPATEIGGKLLKAKLPDINQELPELAVRTSSMDTSTSRTQSLDADHLLSNAEKPTNLKSIACPVGCLELESSSRWVKRLKLSPTSARGTKSSKMEEAFSHKKVNNVFSKIKKCSITSSEPVTGRSHGTERAALNQIASLWNDKSTSLDSVRENLDATLSHPWIRRWCHNEVASSLKKSKAVVDSKPQCSKGTINKFQKRQFPSLAAMALMGKAMGGFRSCQFAKKGSSVVWSS
ncbi:hypothetical protein TorRG33x02_182040 [Trema orientale]|uniref:F-box family protein n=1 Tax=Trema orientale TaxID=63057 RepID=A0A2P5EKD7_TREOI|nr:hypothetical protein TorRG33x02_182040 [Trema orientale]